MTTTPHRTPTEAERRFYDCPGWCTRWDHSADVVGVDEPAIHYGPDFGNAGVQGNGTNLHALVYLGGEGCFVSDPEELRRTAAGMIEAAKWLEAHQ